MIKRLFSSRKWTLAGTTLWTAATCLFNSGCMSSGPAGTSGGLADLIPGYHEAALRKRVDADSFPTADQALHASVSSVGNRDGS